MVLNLYVQQDALVQQVVDEEVRVECDMERREGIIVREEDREEVIEIQVESVQSYGMGQSWVSVEEEEELDEIRDNEVEPDLMNKDYGSEMGWQDFTEVSYDGEESTLEIVKEGDHVLSTTKVKQKKEIHTEERGTAVKTVENSQDMGDIQSHNM